MSHGILTSQALNTTRSLGYTYSMTNPLTSLFAWIQANKFSSFLLAVVVFLIIRESRMGVMPLTKMMGQSEYSVSRGGVMMDAPMIEPAMMNTKAMPISARPPMADTYGMDIGTNRLVSRTTSLSLKVSDVPETLRTIESLTAQWGGFVVNSSAAALDDTASGYISLRIPTTQREAALVELRKIGVSVVSESVDGTDITDQYQDTTEQLRILTETKTKVEALLNRAGTVADMLDAQRELMNLQSQIDSLKGQQEYLAKSAEFTLITAYLSTDELALPYTPGSQAWRPGVVFKEAARELLANVRSVGNAIIWVLVYAPVWLLGIGAYFWWIKRSQK